MSKKKFKNFLKSLSKIYSVLGVLFIFLAFGLITIAIYPQLWYQINTKATRSELNSLVVQTEDLEKEDKVSDQEKDSDLPPLDTSLPKTNTLIISSIGVNGPINENTSPYEGLELGIWRVNDWGTPKDDFPTIIAAHRFGYIYWTSNFRKTESFYNLPKTRVGERVQIIWEQRKYEYEIYKSEDATQITDYNADLILYTCKMYNSPVRVFRYLNRVN